MNANTKTDAEQHSEPASVATYVLTFAALMVLTFLTVFVSRGVELGALSLPVALLIAFTKFSVVLLIFMHVWGESKLIILMLIATAFYISLFFGMTVIDTHTRGIGSPMETMQYYRESNNLAVINHIESAHDEEQAADAEEAPEQPAAADDAAAEDADAENTDAEDANADADAEEANADADAEEADAEDANAEDANADADAEDADAEDDAAE